MTERPLPFEAIANRPALETARPGFAVDLRRCIGCHACSVACKTAHDVPLGEFPLRVRWLPRPSGSDERDTSSGGYDGTYAFVPVFSESLCHDDTESTRAGMAPACVRACPTDAIRFGDLDDAESPVARAAKSDSASRLAGPEATDLKQDVVYLGLEAWVAGKLNLGAALDPRDEDPIYEQR